MGSLASAFERMRQKPEAVRVRYLFFSVGISFVFVAALWAFSLKASFGTLLNNDVGDAVGTLRESAQNIQESAPVSLEDLLKTGKSLQETAEQLPSESLKPSTPETTDFLPANGISSEGDASDVGGDFSGGSNAAAVPEAPASVADGAGSGKE
ncbi:MAG: hypothetical protein IPK84_02755 [Candidatus Moraniibacteriota bacterium]|nr:MAG: hypothetical protein IPK84_02755 [Candidatus Moranbacteria bacterium]